MARRNRPEKRTIKPDPVYKKEIITRVDKQNTLEG